MPGESRPDPACARGGRRRPSRYRPSRQNVPSAKPAWPSALAARVKAQVGRAVGLAQREATGHSGSALKHGATATIAARVRLATGVTVATPEGLRVANVVGLLPGADARAMRAAHRMATTVVRKAVVLMTVPRTTGAARHAARRATESGTALVMTGRGLLVRLVREAKTAAGWASAGLVTDARTIDVAMIVARVTAAWTTGVLTIAGSMTAAMTSDVKGLAPRSATAMTAARLLAAASARGRAVLQPAAEATAAKSDGATGGIVVETGSSDPTDPHALDRGGLNVRIDRTGLSAAGLASAVRVVSARAFAAARGLCPGARQAMPVKGKAFG